MAPDGIVNRSSLQPAQLLSEIGLDEGQQDTTRVGSLEGNQKSHLISLSAPKTIGGVLNGGNPGANKLSDLQFNAIAPQQIGVKRDEAVKQLNFLINLIEAGRNHETGELNASSQELSDHLERFSMAFSQLGDGPAVGDNLMARMESLDELQKALENRMADGFDEYPPVIREPLQGLYSSLLGQIEDRISYTAHTMVDSPLSLSRMYESKAQFSEGAVRVINQQLERQDLSNEQRTALEQARDQIFGTRIDALLNKAEGSVGQLGDPKEVVGKKPAKGLSSLFNSEQKRARETHVRELMSQQGTSVNTPKIDEQTIIHDTLKQVFKNAGLSTSGLNHEFHKAMNDVLNQDQDWAPIIREIQLQTGSETVLSYSETTPAGNFIDAYSGKGFNAHSATEYNHAVNLAQTRLVDGEGNELFNGLRHGVISAFGINLAEIRHMSDKDLGEMVETLLPKENWMRENEREYRLAQALSGSGLIDEPEIELGGPSLNETLAVVRESADLVDIMRQNANLNRARETVLATVLTDPDLKQRALNGEEVPIDILSISLLTPDNIRPVVKGPNENERQMVNDQIKAWQGVKDTQTFQILNNDGELQQIKVKVNPIACNYGVNAGGVGGASWLAGGWDNVKGINATAISQLLGDDVEGMAQGGMPGGLIGERMQALERQVVIDSDALKRAKQGQDDEQIRLAGMSLQNSQGQLDQARELVRQIAEIQHEGSFSKAGKEPYKMPTRLAVLGEMFGLKVMFNCKSGKDRTGELDAEIKHFKLQMALTGKVPHYERVRSGPEITQFHEVLTHSGNFEMQRLNTGYAGYKLLGVDALYEQFGGQGKNDPLTANFLGLSSYTQS